MDAKIFIILLFCVVLGRSESLVHKNPCSFKCQLPWPSFIKQDYGNFVYNLKAKTQLNIGKLQNVTINADVVLMIPTGCRATFLLENVLIKGDNLDNLTLAEELSANTIDFGYFGYEDQLFLCTTDEPEWVLNFKRAIASAFQIRHLPESEIETDEIEEGDVLGICPTTYSRLNEIEQEITILKKKNLNQCAGRRIDSYKFSGFFYGLNNLFTSMIQPFDSKSSCRITIKDKLINNVECEETHTLLYGPFKPILKSSIELSLKERKFETFSKLSDIYRKENIYMDYDQQQMVVKGDVFIVLKNLCSAITEKISNIKASTYFSDVVEKLRHLSRSETFSVAEMIKERKICSDKPEQLQTLFFDALSYSATDASIEILVDAYKTKELSTTHAALVFTLLSFNVEPSPENVDALYPIIKYSNASRPIILAFSVLGKRNCQTYSPSESVGDAYNYFREEIEKTDDEIRKITMIKVLENLNQNNIADFDEFMLKIYDSNVGISCKVAAINAMYGENFFQEETKLSLLEKLTKIIEAEYEADEIRIAAFRKYVEIGKYDFLYHDLPLSKFEIINRSVKNYITSYVENRRKLENSLSSTRLFDKRELKSNEFVIGERFEGLNFSSLPTIDSNEIENEETTDEYSRNIIYQYKEYVFEMDIIQSERSSQIYSKTSSKYYRVHKKNVFGVLYELFELNIKHADIDLLKLLAIIKNKRCKVSKLQISARIKQNNIFFTDACEDIQALIELIVEPIEKTLFETKYQHGMGSVLIDSKMIFSSIVGLPVIFQFKNDLLFQHYTSDSLNYHEKHFILHHSLISGIHSSLGLQVKNKTIGYEYDAKLSFTPHFDIQSTSNMSMSSIRFNIENKKIKLFEFQNSLEEIGKPDEERTITESAPEVCQQLMIMKYCKQTTQTKGPIPSNIELYAMKPEDDITAIVGLIRRVKSDNLNKLILEIDAHGGTKSYEHFIIFSRNEQKKFQDTYLTLFIKTPDRKFEITARSNFNNAQINITIDSKDLINLNMTINNMFDIINKEMQRDVLIKYIYPGQSTTIHNMTYNDKLMMTGPLKFEYTSNFLSSEKPYLNNLNSALIEKKPLESDVAIFESKYGKNYEKLYRYSKITKFNFIRKEPFEATAETNISYILSEYDINYEIKQNLSIFMRNPSSFEISSNTTAIDLSEKNSQINNKWTMNIYFHYSDANYYGRYAHTRLDVHLNVKGDKTSLKSELIKFNDFHFRGNATIQYDEDKTIFIDLSHRKNRYLGLSTFSKIIIKYSHKPEVIKIDFRKVFDNFITSIDVTENDEVLFLIDFRYEKIGKAMIIYSKNDKKYLLTIDNVYEMKNAELDIFNQDNRLYGITFKREPLKYIDFKLVGSEDAYFKNGNLHLSYFNESRLSLLSNSNIEFEAIVDILTSTKKIMLKLVNPEYKFIYKNNIEYEIMRNKLLNDLYIKIYEHQFKYSVDADIGERKLLIMFYHITQEGTAKIKFRNVQDKFLIESSSFTLNGTIDQNDETGKITSKNVEKNYELESKYRFEENHLIIEPVITKNAKLEGRISLTSETELKLEIPETKFHLKLDTTSYPTKKIFKFYFQNPDYLKNIDAEFEIGHVLHFNSTTKNKKLEKKSIISIEDGSAKEFETNLERIFS